MGCGRQLGLGEYKVFIPHTQRKRIFMCKMLRYYFTAWKMKIKMEQLIIRFIALYIQYE